MAKASWLPLPKTIPPARAIKALGDNDKVGGLKLARAILH
jgi:hypothetical protein